MIPILPCRSIDDQIAFYESLGFEVAYRQKAPNVYASVQRGGIELHFFVMKGYDPAGSYSSCYVMVDDIDPLYADFRAGLKRALGRIPTRGIPRVGALRDMSYGVRQFLMTDPGGNIIRIGQPLDAKALQTDGGLPRLEMALEAASLLMDSKADPETAARVLDGALAVTAAARSLQRRSGTTRAPRPRDGRTDRPSSAHRERRPSSGGSCGRRLRDRSARHSRPAPGCRCLWPLRAQGPG